MNLVGINAKKEEKGACIWSAIYAKTESVFISPEEAVGAGELIARHRPACAKPAIVGQAWFEDKIAILIRWMKTNCNCGTIYDEYLTLLENTGWFFYEFVKS